MALADWYPAIKAAHVGLALLSGGLFAGRGLGVLLGAATPLSAPVRRLSQAVDSALLAAALLLLASLRFEPLAMPWLQAKLLLLLAYIGLGTLALRRAPTAASRALAFAAALCCFVAMLGIARTRDPLGWLRWLGG